MEYGKSQIAWPLSCSNLQAWWGLWICIFDKFPGSLYCWYRAHSLRVTVLVPASLFLKCLPRWGSGKRLADKAQMIYACSQTKNTIITLKVRLLSSSNSLVYQNDVSIYSSFTLVEREVLKEIFTSQVIIKIEYNSSFIVIWSSMSFS